MDERPTVVIGLLALWLLPIFVSAARFVFNKVYPLMAQRMVPWDLKGMDGIGLDEEIQY